jgi:hypothetical protein
MPAVSPPGVRLWLLAFRRKADRRQVYAEEMKGDVEPVCALAQTEVLS